MINLFVTGKDTKDPQISKSLNALNWAFESRWDVFDFLNFDNLSRGYPHFGPLKGSGKERREHQFPSISKHGCRVKWSKTLKSFDRYTIHVETEFRWICIHGALLNNGQFHRDKNEVYGENWITETTQWDPKYHIWLNRLSHGGIRLIKITRFLHDNHSEQINITQA